MGRLLQKPSGANGVAGQDIAIAGLQGASQAEPGGVVSGLGPLLYGLQRPHRRRINGGGRSVRQSMCRKGGGHNRQHRYHEREAGHLAVRVMRGTSISCMEMPPCWNVPR